MGSVSDTMRRAQDLLAYLMITVRNAEVMGVEAIADDYLFKVESNDRLLQHVARVSTACACLAPPHTICEWNG